MALVVQKYGGSSVADADGIKRVAQRIVATRKAGNSVVVAVSAMGDTTDDLIDLANQVSPLPPGRELDMLLTAGERISMSLLAMAIANLGLEGRSFTGSQAGVITDSTHGRARIIDVTPGRIQLALDAGAIPIVAGFQGVSQSSKDVTTLGRGGTDTTAVALAAALGADVCEIYTDVDGVFTADPRIVPGAQRIPQISYEEMLEMAACGAKVLMVRCVEYARRYGIPIHVRSSFSNQEGTWVRSKGTGAAGTGAAGTGAASTGTASTRTAGQETEDREMEQAIISGVAHDRGEAKLTVVGVPDKVGEAARIFRAVAGAAINIDMIVQNVSAAATGRTDISFTLPREDGQAAMTTLRALQDEVGFDSLLYDDRIGKVSLVGAGMRSNPGVSATFFGALAEAGVNIEMISTSEIRISVVVSENDVNVAVNATHVAFELGNGEDGPAIVYGERPMSARPSFRPVLAIVGATGAVGTVMRDIVSTRDDLWGEVRLIASARSAGRALRVCGEDVIVQELSAEVFDGVDLAMFDVPDEVSAAWAPVAAARGVVVIDKSGAFRMDPEVPLVVPEVNPDAAARRPRGIISVPNCTTLSLIVVIAALHKEFGLRELVAASYQAASGAGKAGTDALYDQLSQVAGNRTLGQRAGDVRGAVGDLGPFPAPLALNVVPWAGSLRDQGWSSEELKIRNETRKILGMPQLKVSATCVRVPVITGHSLALHAVFDSEVSRADAQRVLADAPGVVLTDDPERGEYPTPADVVGTDPTWVGRVRQSQDDPHVLDLFVCGDNLRKGAALNAAQIAELLVPEFSARAASAPAP